MSWDSIMQQSDRLHFCPFCKQRIEHSKGLVRVYHDRYYHVKCYELLKSNQTKLMQ
jgi:hypothetical protein